MNADRSASVSLHKAYVKCCEAQLKEWLNPEGQRSTQEFCTAEKTAWMEHMRQHLPVQYDNLMRLEQMNF